MGTHPLNLSDDASSAGASVLDLERYLPEVEDAFASEEEAIEFLRTLWNIMCAFVDLGWGVDSVHFAFPEFARVQDRASESEDS
ncbi:MAG: hypothetical protein NT015_02955 [Alphaproteobacteria bacterium]|nr:hypothetical protein [Alphaproteobacteria bacterium]